MSNHSPLILHGLTKRFGRKLAINNVSLELCEGEVFGFLGPNGAGKSTTIRSVMDFLRPTDGWVELLGGQSFQERTTLHDRVGYLAGDIALYENMTGRKLLKFLARTGRKVDWRYVDELAGRFEAALDRPIRQLSKGNRQKIGLIQAFMHRPKLLILDEPINGLDPMGIREMWDLFFNLAKADGMTLLISSHILTEIEHIADAIGEFSFLLGYIIFESRIGFKTFIDSLIYLRKNILYRLLRIRAYSADVAFTWRHIELDTRQTSTVLSAVVLFL